MELFILLQMQKDTNPSSHEFHSRSKSILIIASSVCRRVFGEREEGSSPL
jgi:hypothetical protein